MRMMLKVATVLLPLPLLLPAQQWEVGGSAGYGLFKDVSVTSPTASGKAGFGSGVAFGGLLGNQMNRLVGGEVRYTYRAGDLRVSSGGTKATLGAQSHALHYDVLIHAASKESPVRPFIAAGAGVKLYRGIGTERSFQPLTNLVVLTHTTEAQPLISVGGGVKISASRHALVRLDFRDYMTPLPSNLLATPGSTSIGGWIHDFVFLVGISSVF